MSQGSYTCPRWRLGRQSYVWLGLPSGTYTPSSPGTGWKEREREPAFIGMEGHGTLPCLWTAACLLALAHLEVPLIQLRGSTCQSVLQAWTQKPRAWLGVNEPCAHCSAAVLAGPAVLCPPRRGNGRQQQGWENKQSCPFLPGPWARGQFFPLSSYRHAACRIPPLPEPPPWGPPSLLASFVHSISKDCPVSPLAWFCVVLLRRPERLH